MEKISIAVPCRNEENTIGKLIDQIENQKGIDSIFDYELLIVDGRSRDGTRKIIRDRAKTNSRIRIIDNRRKITPVAYNLGIKNSRYEYVCLIDAHSEIASDYLLQGLKTIRKTGADNVGGPWNGVGQSFVSCAIAVAFHSPFSAGGSTSHNVDFEGNVQSVWGGFFKRDIFKKIGLFDQELVRNQDEELNFRLVKSGGKIWQTKKMKYKYFVRNSISKLFKQYFQYGYWKIKLMQKHSEFASPRFLVPVVFTLSIIIFSILSFFNYYFRLIFAFEIVLYLILNFYFSIASAAKTSLKYLPLLPVIFFTFHFAYGFGQLIGFYSFVLRKKTIGSMSNLSR